LLTSNSTHIYGEYREYGRASSRVIPRAATGSLQHGSNGRFHVVIAGRLWRTRRQRHARTTPRFEPQSVAFLPVANVLAKVPSAPFPVHVQPFLRGDPKSPQEVSEWSEILSEPQ
jgi:hypothetical protein